MTHTKAERLELRTYRLRREQIEWLKARGGRHGASDALREILDLLMEKWGKGK